MLRPILRLRALARRLRPSPRAVAARTSLFSSTAATEDVLLTEQKNGNVLVLLNRPKALNALNAPMVAKLTPEYERWVADSGQQRVVVMKGSGDKAFCAGGDIRAIYDDKIVHQKSPAECCAFFNDEYKLNQIIGTLPSHLTQVALLNGITMGGGVGLSVHGNFRVATDNTMFAMPETAIGFFCDVGGSYFLPRLPRSLGSYLALTGARLKGAEVYTAGVATHYVPQDRMGALEQDLLSAGPADVAGVLERYAATPNADALTPQLEAIDRCFGNESVEDILSALEREDSDWARTATKLLGRMSPTSLKVVLRQMQEGAKRSFGECFVMEAGMAERFMARNDFFEGVRALLVDKDKSPKWDPATLDQVTSAEVDTYFTK